MTNEEAKTKWCPFSRELVWMEEPQAGGDGVAGTHNRPHHPKRESLNCLGSECAVWRGYCGLMPS